MSEPTGRRRVASSRWRYSASAVAPPWRASRSMIRATSVSGRSATARRRRIVAKTYRCAAIPGDGIGKEVVPEGQRVLDAAARRYGFSLAWTAFDWSCELFVKTGRMMPADGLDRLRAFDAIYLGAVGYPGVPDHVSLWG